MKAACDARTFQLRHKGSIKGNQLMIVSLCDKKLGL